MAIDWGDRGVHNINPWLLTIGLVVVMIAVVLALDALSGGVSDALAADAGDDAVYVYSPLGEPEVTCRGWEYGGNCGRKLFDCDNGRTYECVGFSRQLVVS